MRFLSGIADVICFGLLVQFEMTGYRFGVYWLAGVLLFCALLPLFMIRTGGTR